MSRRWPHLVIDARPRGPQGPLAVERVLGKTVLGHLLDLAGTHQQKPVPVHARKDEHARLLAAVADEPTPALVLITGPPPEGAAVLRTDRLYDPSRLGKALRKGKDPETAVIWRLDQPAGLASASDELVRRRTYQPLGRFWALWPARLLAKLLVGTSVRPNAVTLTAAALFLTGAGLVGFASRALEYRLAAAIALALALVLDTADGHLARLQGTASSFGRWLDAVLDELGDMALHAAIAWAAFVRDGHAAWLLCGMAYGMGKHLFASASTFGEENKPAATPHLGAAAARRPGLIEAAHLLGHADIRWHVWIALAALGKLEYELIAFALYYPARTLGGALRKAARRA
jgi:phosphatidylglycerophosphate synthase